MNKTTRLFIRVSEAEKNQIRKAAREYKNLSAFLLFAARDAIKYRRIIEQARKLTQKVSSLKVIEI